MFIVKATAAVLFAAGLCAVSVSLIGDQTPAVRAVAPEGQTEVVEAVGWDAGPGVPTEL